LFLKYVFFGKVWSYISRWPDFLTISSTCLLDHLLQFKCLGGF